MKQDKDLLLLGHFRHNARESLTRISRRTKIPVSTIFDRLRQYESSIIAKHTSLVDFAKLGFDVKAHLLFKVSREDHDRFKAFLLAHPQTNSIFRINNGFDFLVEAVFSSISQLDRFFDDLGVFDVQERKEYFSLKDIMREGFLTPRHGMGLEATILQQ